MKILDRESGYWADQIPTTNEAVCTVIDPQRDHRWHGLRCGGPEVASFLCELEGNNLDEFDSKPEKMNS